MIYDPRTYHSRITRISISNYRSVGNLTWLDLNQLTALVGPNGSGKSNICDAFRFIADALKLGLEAAINKRNGIEAIRRWSPGQPNSLRFLVQIEFTKDVSNHNDAVPHPLEAHYFFALSNSKSKILRVKQEFAMITWSDRDYSSSFFVRYGSWQDGPPELRPYIAPLSLALPLIAGDERFRPIADALRSISIYSIFPDTLREPQKPDQSKPMNEHGANWSSILKDLKTKLQSQDLIAAIGQLTGDIDDFRIKLAAGYLVAEFRHGLSVITGRNGKLRPRWFEAAQESDGTLRMAGILTALLQQPSPTLLGIEEPELTVHPGAIPLLYDHIKEASQRGQIILTTHSPDLLSLLDANEVRVVERRDGVTTVAAMDEAQRLAVHNRLFTPGDLLRMEGLKQQVPTDASRET